MEYGLADMNKNLSQVLQEMRINVILKKNFKDRNTLKTETPYYFIYCEYCLKEGEGYG